MIDRQKRQKLSISWAYMRSVRSSGSVVGVLVTLTVVMFHDTCIPRSKLTKLYILFYLFILSKLRTRCGARTHDPAAKSPMFRRLRQPGALTLHIQKTCGFLRAYHPERSCSARKGEDVICGL